MSLTPASNMVHKCGAQHMAFRPGGVQYWQPLSTTHWQPATVLRQSRKKGINPPPQCSEQGSSACLVAPTNGAQCRLC
jgi:hypothetical protein